MSSFESTSETFSINERIIDEEGYKGTVRYIGPVIVSNPNTIWLGIEWDNNTRGKHDGSVIDKEGNIHRYFYADFGTGSFIKLNKVKKGIEMSEALNSRYVEMDAPVLIDEKDNLIPDAFVLTSKGNAKSIEFYGEKKIRKYQQLNLLDKIMLRNCNISKIDYDKISSLNINENLIEIDLQNNLIFEWDFLFLLCKSFRNLKKVHLNNNKFEKLTPEIVQNIQTKLKNELNISHLPFTFLVLNNCNLKSWYELELLLPLLPNLTELYIASNDFSDLKEIKDDEIKEIEQFSVQNSDASNPSLINTYKILKSLNKLRILDVSYCNFNSWSQIHIFSYLEHLEELICDGNKFSTIDATEKATFHKLSRLSIASCQIDNWKSINNLNNFENLNILRLSQIPLFIGHGASEVRPLVIARIPRLIMFNASNISSRERNDSEKIYLKNILKEKDNLISNNQKTETEVEEILKTNHPLFNKLVEKFKDDYFFSSLYFNKDKNSSNSNTLASDIITVNFQNFNFSHGNNWDKLEKKIPRNITISKLKLLITKLYGIPSEFQILSISNYPSDPPCLMDDENLTLAYYGAENNAEIFINEE